MKVCILKKYITLLFFIILFSCSKSSNGGGVTPLIPTPPNTITTAKLTTLPPGWKFSSNISANFPSGIELYFFDT